MSYKKEDNRGVLLKPLVQVRYDERALAKMARPPNSNRTLGG